MEDKAFEREVLDRLIKIEAKLDGMDKLKEQVYTNKDNILQCELKDTQQQKQIDDILDEQKWLKRTIVGAIIVGVIGIVFLFVQSGMGI